MCNGDALAAFFFPIASMCRMSCCCCCCFLFCCVYWNWRRIVCIVTVAFLLNHKRRCAPQPTTGCDAFLTGGAQRWTRLWLRDIGNDWKSVGRTPTQKCSRIENFLYNQIAVTTHTLLTDVETKGLCKLKDIVCWCSLYIYMCVCISLIETKAVSK